MMEFDKEKAIAGSKKLLTDLMLKDQQGNDAYIMTPPKQDENGNLILACIVEPDDEYMVIHTVSSRMEKVSDIFPELSSRLVGVSKSGKLVDVNGNVIKKD
jgi:hypothetical protein